MTGGPEYVIYVDGKSFRIEMHPYSGPLVLDEHGNPARQPGPRHRLWTAITLWCEQGKRVENGVAVWDKPPTQRTVHIAGKHYVSVSIDDPRSDWRIRGDTLQRLKLDAPK